MSHDLNLDVDTPEDCIKVLRDAAQEYYHSYGDLFAAWQDKGAGKIWEYAGKELEKAADNIERKWGELKL